jgi:hypothetical protein
MGRYAKAPGTVRRPSRQHWRELSDPADATAPPLPERYDGGDWTPEARRAWSSWWASPMASAWIPSDAVVLRRAIRLLDDAERGRRGTDTALLALLDRMGLTPSGRLRLQWLVKAEPAEPAPVVPLKPSRDPRV